MPFNDEIESGDFEYELVLPRQRLFFRDWPTLYYHHQPAAHVESAAPSHWQRWLHKYAMVGGNLRLRLERDLWPGIVHTVTISSVHPFLEYDRIPTKMELAPLRPGDAASQLLIHRRAEPRMGYTTLFLCHFQSVYAAVTQSGEVLVTYHQSYRDSDSKRGIIACLRLCVGGNHPLADPALLLMTAFSIAITRLRHKADDIITYHDLTIDLPRQE